MIVRLALQWGISAAGLFLAAWLVPGITRGDDYLGLATTAAVLGVINVTIKPIAKLISLPLLAMTLGLFALVINTLALWLASWISQEFFESSFHIDDFPSAFFGAIIVSIVSTIAGFVFRR